MKPVVILAAGGTGGHCYPALACALELQKKNISVTWMGSGPLSEKLANQHTIEYRNTKMHGMHSLNPFSLLYLSIVLVVRTIVCIMQLRTMKASVSISFGGYPAAPVGLASYLCRIPLILHEQNSVAGKVNRMLAPLASKIALSYQPCKYLDANSNTIFIGNPLRPMQVVRKSRLDNTFHILILGGSQGAHAINELVVDAHSIISQELVCKLVHQCGVKHKDHVARRYQQKNIEIHGLYGFMNPIDPWYEWCDLVIARAGAMTLAELAALGIPAILIPLPTAAGNHQWHNAVYFQERGAACVITQSQCTAQKLASMVCDIARNPHKQKNMNLSMRTLSYTNATESLVSLALNMPLKSKKVKAA